MRLFRAIKDVIHNSMSYQILLLQRKIDITERKRSMIEKDLTELRIYLAKKHKIHSVPSQDL